MKFFILKMIDRKAELNKVCALLHLNDIKCTEFNKILINIFSFNYRAKKTLICLQPDFKFSTDLNFGRKT